MRRDLALAGIVGALSARPRRDLQASYPQLTAIGLPGCRAPGGRFEATVLAWPPSKSNTYKIVHTRSRKVLRDLGSGMYSPEEHATLAAGDAVVDFKPKLADAIVRALDQLRYRLEWFINPGTKYPGPVNPLFGADCEVTLTIAIGEPWRTARDTGNVEKIVGDVLTDLGVWWDDAQVGDVYILRRGLCGMQANDLCRIVVEWDGRSASWLANPGKRPVTTAQMRKLGIPPSVAATQRARDAEATVSHALASVIFS